VSGAAHQIAINLSTISYMTTSGLAAAATIRVSNELGRRDFAGVRRVSMVLVGMALALMTFFALIFLAGNQLLPGLYVNDLEVIPIASSLIVIAGLFQLADGLQVVCIGALRGLHDVKVPSILIFVSYWVVGLPLGYCLGFKMGLGAQGIWLGLLIGLSLTATAVFMRLRTMTARLLIVQS
jgi:MATE family multidrug resistance protein